MIPPRAPDVRPEPRLTSDCAFHGVPARAPPRRRRLDGHYDGRIAVAAIEPDGWAVVEMWVEQGRTDPGLLRLEQAGILVPQNVNVTFTELPRWEDVERVRLHTSPHVIGATVGVFRQWLESL